MKLYYQGSHLPTYRNLIKETGTPTSSLSYMGLRNRTNFGKPWKVSKYFPEGHSLFVDSGCQALNNAKEQKYTNEELLEIRDHYYSWVEENIDDIEIYSEFDALQLGTAYILDYRKNVTGVMRDKLLPIWREDWGFQELQRIAEQFGRVGLAQTQMNGRDLVISLNRLADKGVELHGLAMTKQDIMQSVKWTSVSSTSWISPQKYGATFVWSHNQLKSYSKEQKDQARRKERFVIEAAGFDAEKILKEDPKELLRLSLWSWSQFVDSINSKKQRGVTTVAFSADDDFTENYDDGVGGVLEPIRNRVSTPVRRNPSEMRVIPLIDLQENIEKKRNPKTGELESISAPTLKSRSDSMRLCDTCFLASKCPMFEENATCAYDIPITIRTKDQMQALMDTLVEIQTQRVLFMKMAEDAEGGHADPILSSEIDRLVKMSKTKHDMEQEGFSVTISAKQNGQAGIVDRIFGDMGNTGKLRELESPQQPENLANQLGIIDVEAY